MSEVAVENVQVHERFDVDNDMKAEWCLSKIRKIRQEQKRDTEELDRQMKFYQDQKDIVKIRADEEVAFFESMLHGYFNDRVEAGFVKATKTKVAYKLPTGDLVLKHREPEYDRNDAAVIEWLEKNGEQKFIKVKKELDWAGLKKTLTISGKAVATKEGEIIPGIEVTEREDDFVVEVK